MAKERLLKTIKFRTKCGTEFEAVINQDGNWQGFIEIGRVPCNPKELPEIITKFGATGMAEDCKACTLDKTWQEEHKTLCKRGEEFHKSFGAIVTYCVADIISNPFPTKCPVTGYPFERLAWDMNIDEVIPLYKEAEGKLVTGMELRLSFGSLEYMFRRVESLDDDGCINYQTGMYIYKDTKKSICDTLTLIKDSLDKTTEAFEKAKYLLEAFKDLKNDDEDDENDEDSDGDYGSEE